MKIEKQTIISKFIIILSTILWISKSAFIQHPNIRTGYVTIVNSGSLFASFTTPISYNISFTSSLTGTSSIGIGIVGFKAPITNDLSLNVTIDIFTISLFRITGRVYGDTVLTFFAVNYIALGPTVDFLEVQYTCFLCTTLNTGNGTRTQVRTSTTFFVATTLASQVYLSSFQMHNSEGINNYLQASSSISSGSSTINLIFTTYENNTLTSICYTTIIYYPAITQINYYNFVYQGKNTLSNTTTPSVIYSDPNADKYNDTNNMFFGMSSLNVSRAHERLFSVVTSDPNLNTNYQSNYGTYAVIFSYIYASYRQCNISSDKWFDVTDETCKNDNLCTPGTYQTLPGYFCQICHYTCLTCNAAYYNNCTSCSNVDFRTLSTNKCPCDPGYVDVGNSNPLCYPCSTFMAGCNTCTTTISCISCLSGFVLNFNGTCSCTSGFLITGVCTDIVGCVSAFQYGGVDQCFSCNSSQYFQRTSNFLCQCITGYTLSGSTCVFKCGDGIKVTGQECDDGNTINGDGCSSVCVIQTGWSCITTSNPSKCTIIISPTLTLRYVYRNPYANQMQIAIDISPKYSQFTQAKFKSLISHNIPVTDFNATYDSSGLLIINFAYNQSIEGNTYNLSLTLDPDYFSANSTSLLIPAIGMNVKLTYDSYYQSNYILQIIIYILDALALLVFVLSLISQRMIGVQMIQTLQITLFAMTLMGSVPAPLSPLQKLKYTNGYNFISNDDKSRQFTYTFGLSAIGIQKQFLLSFNFMYILLLIVLAACLVAKILQVVARKNLQQIRDIKTSISENRKNYEIKTKIFNFIFERVLFLVGFISMYMIIFSMAVQLSDLSALYTMIAKQFNLLSAGVAFLIILALITLVLVNAIYPPTNLFPFYFSYRSYTSFYFIYRLAMILSLSFVYTQSWLVYVFLGTSLLSLILCIIIRPYPEHIHNTAIVFHEIVVMLVLGVYLYEVLTNYNNSSNQIFFEISAYIITLLLYVVVLWNGYRLWRWYKYMEQNDELLKKNKGYQENNQQKPLIQINKLGTPKNYKNKLLEIQLLNYTKDDNLTTENRRKDDQFKNEALDWTYNQILQQPYQKGNNDQDGQFGKINKNGYKSKANLNPNLDSMGKSKSSYDLKQQPKKKNINLTIDQAEQISDKNKKKESPYDQYGYIKDGNDVYDGEDGQTIDDALKRIKRRLRKDYNEKLRQSSIAYNNNTPNKEGGEVPADQFVMAQNNNQI